MADAADFSIFVGDLAPDVGDDYLENFFRQYFPSVKTAKVITDPVTSRSKGYGFVRFGSEAERDRALKELSGAYISSRPVRVSVATAKKAPVVSSGGGSSVSASSAAVLLNMPAAAGPHPAPPPGAHPADTDPTNTTLFIGGLSAVVAEEQLRSIFGRYGDIIYTKVPQGKGCGFVQFVDRRAAEHAISAMNGQVIGNSAIRISWGRSSSKTAAAAAQAQHHAPSAAHPLAAAPYGYHPHGYSMAYSPYDHGAAGYASYGMYAHDPYAAGYHAPYPYPAYAYGMMPAGMYPVDPGHHASTSAGGALVPGMPAPSGPYDPKVAPSVDKLNAMYMHRHMPILTGGYMRMPMMPPQ